MYTVEYAPSIGAKNTDHTVIRDIPHLEDAQNVVAEGMVSGNLRSYGSGIYVYWHKEIGSRKQTIEQWVFYSHIGISNQYEGWVAEIWHGMRVIGETKSYRKSMGED